VLILFSPPRRSASATASHGLDSRVETLRDQLSRSPLLKVVPEDAVAASK